MVVWPRADREALVITLQQLETPHANVTYVRCRPDALEWGVTKSRDDMYPFADSNWLNGEQCHIPTRGAVVDRRVVG